MAKIIYIDLFLIYLTLSGMYLKKFAGIFGVLEEISKFTLKVVIALELITVMFIIWGLRTWI